jgi:phosphoglycerate dehydrogenase-like enzyme
MAEWAFGAWISHEHRFGFYAEQQRAATWGSKPSLSTPIKDAMGRRMGIVGYGAIGRQCARLAQAFGMEVYAYTKSPRPTPESRKHVGYFVQGTGDVDGLIPTKWFSGDSVEEFLAQELDVLILCLPLNNGTRHLLGRSQFSILAKGSKKTFVINIARGPIVDTDALIDALGKGLIGGAALDVTDPEPLPDDHPLWSAPNIFITPHVSWQSANVINRTLDLLYQNLERRDTGEPLLNPVHR